MRAMKSSKTEMMIVPEVFKARLSNLFLEPDVQLCKESIRRLVEKQYLLSKFLQLVRRSKLVHPPQDSIVHRFIRCHSIFPEPRMFCPYIVCKQYVSVLLTIFRFGSDSPIRL